MFEALLSAGREADRYLDIFDEYNPEIDDEEIPKSVSKHFLNLESLKKQYQYNQDYIKNVENISKTYIGWKKSRGDGNCYYRSVISSFFLKIFHYNRPSNELQKFIQKLENILSRKEFDQFSYEVNQILPFLRKALVESNNFQKKIENFVNANKKLQDTKFDINLIQISRVIALMGLEVLIRDYGFGDFMVGDEIELMKANILEMGREAEGMELQALPVGLGIVVTQINFLNQKVLKNIYTLDDHVEGKIQVSIISKSKGHYDGLFSKQEQETEMLNPFNRRYYLKP
jgi:hypothetical protein